MNSIGINRHASPPVRHFAYSTNLFEFQNDAFEILFAKFFVVVKRESNFNANALTAFALTCYATYRFI